MPTAKRPSLRRMLVTAAAAGAVTLASLTPAGAVAPQPHWGLYKWGGGAESASIRGFWLFDRTGDPQLHEIIGWVADAWNSVIEDNPQMPYIAVYRDDANAGKCFLNTTPGYSVASACTLFQNTEGIKAVTARNPDADGHLTGGAFAVATGLTEKEAVTVVCHAFGHLMGLENSDDDDSCMTHGSFEPDRLEWYNHADAVAIFDLYQHSETAAPTTTSSSTSVATTTTVAETTTTTAPVEATTTTAPPETTTTTAPVVSLPDTTLPDLPTTTPGV